MRAKSQYQGREGTAKNEMLARGKGERGGLRMFQGVSTDRAHQVEGEETEAGADTCVDMGAPGLRCSGGFQVVLAAFWVQEKVRFSSKNERRGSGKRRWGRAVKELCFRVGMGWEVTEARGGRKQG